MSEVVSVVHIDPDILGGVPVFRGTRVPVQALFDYLSDNQTVEEFLDDFPTVTRAQVVVVLEQANKLLVSHAHSA